MIILCCIIAFSRIIRRRRAVQEQATKSIARRKITTVTEPSAADAEKADRLTSGNDSAIEVGSGAVIAPGECECRWEEPSEECYRQCTERSHGVKERSGLGPLRTLAVLGALAQTGPTPNNKRQVKARRPDLPSPIHSFHFVGLRYCGLVLIWQRIDQIPVGSLTLASTWDNVMHGVFHLQRYNLQPYCHYYSSIGSGSTSGSSPDSSNAFKRPLETSSSPSSGGHKRIICCSRTHVPCHCRFHPRAVCWGFVSLQGTWFEWQTVPG